MSHLSCGDHPTLKVGDVGLDSEMFRFSQKLTPSLLRHPDSRLHRAGGVGDHVDGDHEDAAATAHWTVGAGELAAGDYLEVSDCRRLLMWTSSRPLSPSKAEVTQEGGHHVAGVQV